MWARWRWASAEAGSVCDSRQCDMMQRLLPLPQEVLSSLGGRAREGAGGLCLPGLLRAPAGPRSGAALGLLLRVPLGLLVWSLFPLRVALLGVGPEARLPVPPRLPVVLSLSQWAPPPQLLLLRLPLPSLPWCLPVPLWPLPLVGGGGGGGAGASVKGRRARSRAGSRSAWRVVGSKVQRWCMNLNLRQRGVSCSGCRAAT